MEKKVEHKKKKKMETIFVPNRMENDETVAELNENKMYLWRWTVSRHTDVIYLT